MPLNPPNPLDPPTAHAPQPLGLSRRRFLERSGAGFGALALPGLLGAAGLTGASAAAHAATSSPMAPRQPHFAPRAKHVIHIFLNGGPSHVDTFDPKPALTRWHGKAIPNNLPTERPTGAALGSPFSFAQYGQSGLPISEVFAPLGAHADDLCVVRSMYAEVPNHEPSLMLMNCGTSQLVRPSLGSWVTYGLGTENANLPGFIAMCPGGRPIKGEQNWQSAFLPGAFQGTHLDTRHTDVTKLLDNIKPIGMGQPEQRRMLDLAQRLNQRHLEARGQDPDLESRLHSFELAYRMQMEASEALDIARESQETRERYGDTAQGRQLLMARRLVERGVRFVQLWHGEGQPWDNHDDIADNHRRLAGQCAKGIAALLTDLKDRGLFEDTLVIWGGEFGRTPTVELPRPGSNAGKVNGRDHNHYGFTVWLAGGGAKGGHVHGQTDEFGFRAVEDRVHVHDLHATVLHLLGFDHTRLTYRFAGRDFRLTDVHGQVVRELLA